MSHARRLLAAALVPAALALTAGVAAAPSTAASAKPGLIACTHKIVTKPKAYALACGDGNIGLLKVKWTTFGGKKATGTGTLAVNLCEPNCAAGKIRNTSVTITASRPKKFAAGTSYTRIGLTAASAKKAGSYGVDKNGPYSLQG